MSPDQLLYQVALTLIPNIGPVQAKILLQYFDAPAIFKTKRHILERIEGIGSIRAESIRSFNHFAEAEQEILFMEKNNIRPLFITDKDYPQRLLHCYDSPTLLYYRGQADLNMSRVIAVIGTRNHTEYGKHVTEKFIRELASQKVMVISGLAFGIDALAHRSALRYGLPTVGVLAHGLHTLYPFEHMNLAREMARDGGLLSEFNSQAKPDKHNFPVRNRIVAGMSDAVIVIETGIKGGSMITAELANGYNRDVFAFPGKITDSKSAGCNYLIKNNKAVLLTDTRELIELMGWDDNLKNKKKERIQKELFIELTKEEGIVVDILKEKQTMHIDEINLRSNLGSSVVAAAILNLELKNMISSFPGKIYSLS